MQMDLDRVLGAVLGVLILITVFLLPFGYITLPSGRVSEQTFFLTVEQLIENITVEIQQPTLLLFYEIMLVVSFSTMIIAGVLGFHPVRSGAVGILGMIMLTVLSVFHPQRGFNIPSYGIGYFAAWGLSIAEVLIGKLQPQTRRKLSFLSRKEGVVAEQSVEKFTLPSDLLKPLSETEESESSALPTPPLKDLFLQYSFPKTEKHPSQPALQLPSPQVKVNAVEEEISKIRVFLDLLKEERDNGLLSERAYDGLKVRLDEILKGLEEEKERIINSS